MNTIEQLMDIICPVIGDVAEIRTIFDVTLGRMCPVYSEPVFRECNLSQSCPGYQVKDKRCCLFQDFDMIIDIG